MSNNVDNLLDAALTSDWTDTIDGQTDHTRSVLFINQTTRTINYDGTLVLGVEGDKFAERIFFKTDPTLYKYDGDRIYLDADNITIQIKYKNANNVYYVYECIKEGMQEDGSFCFSWLLSEYVTAKAGKVEFQVCVNGYDDSFGAIEFSLPDESTVKDDNLTPSLSSPLWNTTTFEGVVLPSLNTTDEDIAKTVLYINEPTRTINYDGNLILGVKGDRFAERIYFNCPQFVHKDDSVTIDLSLDTTKIYINYKNANNEPYIEECSKGGVQEDGSYLFSWFVSDIAAIQNGKVTFNVCVKDESGNFTDASGDVIVNEWHTTTFEGTILPAVDVSAKTPEVITSDTVTSQAIVDAYTEFTAQLSDVNEYIDNEMAKTYLPLTGGTLTGDLIGTTIKGNEIKIEDWYTLNFMSAGLLFDTTHQYAATSHTLIFKEVGKNQSNISFPKNTTGTVALLDNVPTKVSELENDIGFVTASHTHDDYPQFKFLNIYSYEDTTEFRTIDIHNYIETYNEIMIICRSVIAGDAQRIISMSTTNGQVLKIDGLEGTKYVKILINKTGADNNGDQYLDITSVDLVNGAEFSWTQFTQETTLDLEIQGTVTSSSISVKIYGR